jgi:NADH:ubiquinone oxidoreductase subunit 4 (subunit M)
MAAPPTFNLISEVLVIRRILLARDLNSFLLVLIVLLSTAYSLIMYRSTTQGVALIPSNFKYSNTSELLVIFNHLI